MARHYIMVSTVGIATKFITPWFSRVICLTMTKAFSIFYKICLFPPDLSKTVHGQNLEGKPIERTNHKEDNG